MTDKIDCTNDIFITLVISSLAGHALTISSLRRTNVEGDILGALTGASAVLLGTFLDMKYDGNNCDCNYLLKELAFAAVGGLLGGKYGAAIGVATSFVGGYAYETYKDFYSDNS